MVRTILYTCIAALGALVVGCGGEPAQPGPWQDADGHRWHTVPVGGWGASALRRLPGDVSVESLADRHDTAGDTE
mgnify:CR=1 FL=1